MMYVDQFLLSYLELGHEIVIPVLGGLLPSGIQGLGAIPEGVPSQRDPHCPRSRRRPAIAIPAVEPQELILPEGVELAKVTYPRHDARVETEHEVGGAVLVVIRPSKLPHGVVGPPHHLKTLGVRGRRHLPPQSELSVPVQSTPGAVVSHDRPVLIAVLGNNRRRRRAGFHGQVPHQEGVVRGFCVQRKVEDEVGVGQGTEDDAVAGFRLILDEEFQEVPAHPRSGPFQTVDVGHVDRASVAGGDRRFADLAEYGEEVHLEVARVPRQLGAHRPAVLPAVDQAPPIQVQPRRLPSDVMQSLRPLQGVYAPPQSIDQPPRRVGPRTDVVILVVLHVLPVPVVALHAQVQGEAARPVARDEVRSRAEGVVIQDGRLVLLPAREALEGREVGLYAAGNEGLAGEYRRE
mmetsp:Transcript_21578/g.63286  ORF Transcript_21578/g.63286 Transcript_21578/m.63286 type:complete len:405 (+) Transcript_21578:5552-6766(+)